MKLGILTFHSQLNYGGVLQCWALKMALEEMGHDVVVVDRWLDRGNASLLCEFSTFSVKGWVKFLVRGIMGCGDWGKLLRTIRTIRFVRGIGLTREHFYQWCDIRKVVNCSLNQLDMLVVGSDQVWHCGDWGDPRVYLLDGAPNIPAISYAASFGMTKFPSKLSSVLDIETESYFRSHLKRFSALSCREREGVVLCSKLGFAAEHVIDPTLLLDPIHWKRLLNKRAKQREHKLVCYFLSEDVNEVLPLLEDYAVRTKCKIELFTNTNSVIKFPRSFLMVYCNWFRHVRIRHAAGPKEFVESISSARNLITDSFHAVMFSAIFACDVRFIIPRDVTRRKMLARIQEFADDVIVGDIFSLSVQDALISFESQKSIVFQSDKIKEKRIQSKSWLRKALCSTSENS